MFTEIYVVWRRLEINLDPASGIRDPSVLCPMSDCSTDDVKYSVAVNLVLIQQYWHSNCHFAETLRKYPPFSILNRECTKRYKIPGTNVILEKGIQVVIPVMGIHHDPQYFPEPEKFDPERFSLEAKSKRHRYVYMPFGEGPRICIGNKTLYIIIRKLHLISFLYIPHITQSNNTIIQRLHPVAYSYVVASKITKMIHSY